MTELSEKDSKIMIKNQQAIPNILETNRKVGNTRKKKFQQRRYKEEQNKKFTSANYNDHELKGRWRVAWPN